MATKKRNNRKRRNLPLTLLLVAVLIFGMGAGTGVIISHLHGAPMAEITTEPPTVPTTAEPTTLGSTSARFMCVGDNLIHGAIYQQAKARATDGGYDFSYAYAGVKDILRLSDFAVLNQETVLNKNRQPSTYPLFNSPTELGDEMVNIGFNVINHSNNHVLDQGTTGAMATIEYWKSKGVVLTGLYENEADMMEVKTNEANDIVFSHVGFTQYLNGLTVPSSSELKVVSPLGAGMTEQEFYATMKKMIEKAKAASDVVCVSMHFQQENITTPNASQEKIMDALIEYGADIIIGNGPHVLQPMKFVTRADGSRALVMYSLGNFISTQNGAYNLVSGIADITVSKNHDTGKVKIKSAKLIPIVTYYGGGKSNVHIVPFKDYTAELAAKHKVSSLTVSYVNDLLNRVIGADFLEVNPK